MSALEAVLADPEIQQEFAALHPIQQTVINWQLNWLEKQAHKHQIEPKGNWWNIWLMLAGRGAGVDLCSVRSSQEGGETS